MILPAGWRGPAFILYPEFQGGHELEPLDALCAVGRHPGAADRRRPAGHAVRAGRRRAAVARHRDRHPDAHWRGSRSTPTRPTACSAPRPARRCACTRSRRPARRRPSDAGVRAPPAAGGTQRSCRPPMMGFVVLKFGAEFTVCRRHAPGCRCTGHRRFRPGCAGVPPGADGALQRRLSRPRTHIRTARPPVRASLYEAGVPSRHDGPSLRSTAASGAHHWLVVTPNGRGVPRAGIRPDNLLSDRARLQHSPRDSPGGPHPWRLRLGRPRLPALARRRLAGHRRAIGGRVCRRGLELHADPGGPRSTGSCGLRDRRLRAMCSVLCGHARSRGVGELDLSDEASSTNIFANRILSHDQESKPHRPRVSGAC